MKKRNWKKTAMVLVGGTLLSLGMVLVDLETVLDRAVLMVALMSMPTTTLSETLSSTVQDSSSSVEVEESPDDPAFYPTILFPQKEESPSYTLPDIPTEYCGRRVETDMSGVGTTGALAFGNSYIKNLTTLTVGEIEEILTVPSTFSFTGGNAPEVLIYHTHTTESYNPYSDGFYDTRYTWRSTNNNYNMAVVGATLKNELEKAGITVLHDTTQHDYPSYNGSYTRSEETVTAYLKEYPSIKLILDLHRDAFEDGAGNVVAPVTTIAGKSAAQVMIIACADNGELDLPYWENNLRFAVALGDKVGEQYPTLLRPINLSFNRYNQHLCPQALLLEFGTHGCTMEEASYSAKLLGEVLGAFIG